MGSLGDRIGRRRLLLIGAVGFSCASLIAAYSTSSAMLIGARALLGVAGATLMPSTLGLIRNMFHDDAQRSKAIGIWTGVMTSGVALGPVLSGFLLEHYWWGSVFLINIPAMVLLLILGPMLLPEHRSEHPGRFDLVSSALSLAAVLPAIYGIKEWAAQGFSIGYPTLILLGAVFAIAFFQRQRSIDHPMLDLHLFVGRLLRGSVALNTVAMFALVGNAIFLTQFLQSVLDMSPMAAALWSLAPSVAVGAAAPTAAVLARRFGAARVMAAGFGVGAAGFFLLTAVEPASPLVLLLIAAGLIAAGLVVVMTLVTENVMAAMDPARAGSAAAVLETSGELGGALGIAILGSIGAAVYRSSIRLPDEVPAAAAITARGTLAGAAVVTGELPGPVGASVLAAGRSAFTAGLHGVGYTAAGLLLVAAAVCPALLRQQLVHPEM